MIRIFIRGQYEFERERKNRYFTDKTRGLS